MNYYALQMLILTAAELQIRQNGGLFQTLCLNFAGNLHLLVDSIQAADKKFFEKKVTKYLRG